LVRAAVLASFSDPFVDANAAAEGVLSPVKRMARSPSVGELTRAV
jgi:hypothetical protein